LSSEQLVSQCLEVIRAREQAVGAWAYLDEQAVLDQARAADRMRRDQRGPLHGVPIAIKDIFDTFDMPTECGSAVLSGRRPRRDATVVSRLRAAGAIIMGKTVTTEFAVAAAGKTRNPHDLSRTPGGSSSGSAAGIAAGMVPLALGSQTGASIIRPAAFCGVVGFKPSFGLISRAGAFRLSRHFDTVGVFAASAEDAALLASLLSGPDPADADTANAAKLRLPRKPSADFAPRFAFLRSPLWERADRDAAEAMRALRKRLGDFAAEIELPAEFAEACAVFQTLCGPEMVQNLLAVVTADSSLISAQLKAVIAAGSAVTALDYLRAGERRANMLARLPQVLAGYDAAVTPATPGIAPPADTGTGDSSFAIPWSLLAGPALTLPLLRGETGLPLGVQLTAAHGGDGRLLRAAHWLERFAQA
jgi:Asp-tRNA(Asn)/Glu-tRNA(Gln) amidotransferase A subunit family amidase